MLETIRTFTYVYECVCNKKNTEQVARFQKTLKKNVEEMNVYLGHAFLFKFITTTQIVIETNTVEPPLIEIKGRKVVSDNKNFG